MNKYKHCMLFTVFFGLTLNTLAAAQASSQSKSAAPADSILATLELPTDFQQTAALYDLLSRADVDDVQRYLEETKSINNANDRQAGAMIIYGRFLDLDPEAAVDHAIGSGPTVSGNLFSSLFYSWSKIDLDAAIQKSQELQSPQLREIARQSIMSAHADMGGQDLAALSSRLGEGGDQALLRQSFESIMRLAQTDPRAAIAEALKTGSAEQQGQMLAMIGSVWGASEPETALDYSSQLSALQRPPFRESVIATLAQRDHDKALALLESDKVTQAERNGLLINAIIPLVQSNPEHALEHTLALENADQRKQTLGILFSQVGQHDPLTAVRLLESMGEPAQWEAYVGYVTESYARKDPDAAFAWASGLEINANQHMSSVVGAVAKQDLDKALELVALMPASQERMQALGDIIEQSARTNPQMAVEFLGLLPPGQMHQDTARRLADAWFKEDAGAAMAWILDLPAQTQANLLQNLSWSLVQQDPQLAMSLYPEITSPKVREQWANSIVHQLAQEDLDRAVSWISGLKGETFQEELLATVTSSVAQRDVPAAMDLANSIRDQYARSQALISIVSVWAARDAHGAATYVRSVRDEELKLNMVSSLLGQWCSYDPDAARAWVMELQDPAMRDHALAVTLANGQAGEAEVEEVIRLFSSDEARYTAIGNYVRTLAQYDTASARKFLSRHALPDDQMTSLLESIDATEQEF